MNKKLLYGGLAVILFAGAVLAIRIFSGPEDSWECTAGTWVQHGHPGQPQPTTPCGAVNANSGVDTKPVVSPSPIVHPIAPDPTKDQSDISVAIPIPGAVVKSPLVIAGQAKGSWYFEAVFPVQLLDENNKLLATGQMRAQGDWMTTDFVPFNGTLQFDKGSAKNGWLIFKNDNPSGLEANSKEFKLPVRFE